MRPRFHASGKTFKNWFTIFINRGIRPLLRQPAPTLSGREIRALLLIEDAAVTLPAAEGLQAVAIPVGDDVDSFRHAAERLADLRRQSPDTAGLILLSATLDHETLDACLPVAIGVRPAGVIVTDLSNGSELQRIDVALSVAEAVAGVEPGTTAIIGICGDNAAGLLASSSFEGKSRRLAALGRNAMRLAESLFADRSHESLSAGLTALAGAAAGVPVIDWLDPGLSGKELREACDRARVNGFSALLTSNHDHLRAIADTYS